MKNYLQKTLKSSVLLLILALTVNVYSQNQFFSITNQSGSITDESNQSGLKSSGCDYLFDDGSIENSLGLTAGGDILWLNAFNATGGCEQIHTVSVAWGLVPDGLDCRIILYDDPNNDGDPSDAVYLAETTTVISNANTGIFADVSFPSTVVSDGFFVAALVQSTLTGEFPAAFDQNSSFGSSYVAGHGTPGAFDVMDLTNNDIAVVLMDDIGFPSNFLVRAVGEPAPPTIPIGNSAILIVFGLITVMVLLRNRFF